MKKVVLTILLTIFCLSLFSGGTLLFLSNDNNTEITSSEITNSDLNDEISAKATSITKGEELNAAIKRNDYDASNTTILSITFDYAYNASKYNLSSATTTSLSISGVSATMYKVPSGSNYHVYILSNSTIYSPSDSSFMFYEFRSLKSISFKNFITSNVRYMRGMFDDCPSLTSIDLSSFNTSNVTNMGAMFSFCESLTSIDLSSFDTSNVTNMGGMFYHCESLTSIDLSSFNTSKVTDMGQMFGGCEKLTSIGLSSFNTSNVTDMSDMFTFCSSLTSIDLSSFNTSNVTTMYYMFYDCSSLTSIDLSSFNTSNVTTMSYMFCYCSSLTSIDLSSFNTSNVTNMSCMFPGCSSLTSIDLSSFKTSNVMYMKHMFYGCSSLKTIYVNVDTWSTSRVTSSSSMFYNCTSIVGENGTTYNSSQYTTDKTYARVDGKDGLPGYLTSASCSITLDQQGGTGGTASVTATYGKAMPDIVYPTKTGNIFKGYYTGTSGSGTQYYNEYGTSAKNSDFTTDTTLYAYWTKEKYNLLLYVNKGDDFALKEYTSCEYGSTQTLLTTTKEGYQFKGWRLGDTSTIITNMSYTVPDLGNDGATIKFYGEWEANTYTIKFNANGGSGSMSDLPMTYDVAKSLTANAFTRTGYQLSGWHTDASATEKLYNDTESVRNLTSENGVIVNLYAIWQANSYTIKFNANGGSGSMSDLSMTYDVAKNLTANAFTKLGYKFLGWNTSSTVTSAKYTNGQSVKNLATGVTGDNTVTLYAIWLDTWANHISVPRGSGTSTNPYLIANAGNLAWLSAYCEKTGSLSGYFVQTNAIDLSGYEWLPIGNSTRYFSGNYNGQGYPITNIKITAISGVTSTYQGLFGYISSASTTILQNIYLASGSTSGTNNVGGIVGYAKNANILNCTNMVSIVASSQCAGGIVGYSTNSQIQGCYNYGDVQGSRGIGGIVGYAEEPEILNCYAKGNITGSNSLGGIVGMSPNSTITACAYEGTISGSSYYGAIAGNGNANITNCYAKAVMNSTSTNYGMFNGSGSMNNCVFETGTNTSDLVKRCKGSDFLNWTITISGLPMPSGLAWIATGGVKVSSVGQITQLGYTQV